MTRGAGSGRLSGWAAAGIVGAAIVVVVLVACSSQLVSPQPASVAPTATSTSLDASALPGASASLGPRFDPSHVAVTLMRYVHVAGGPLAIVAPPDGSGRLFIAAQDGRIWIVSKGVVSGTPLLDIGGRITSGGERGLLGIAVHPRFPADPRVFIDYTDTDGNTVVSSFRLDSADGSRLDPSSERIIFTTLQPFPNHNGGALTFGPDGDLYISLGDGGSEGDPLGNGQRRDTTLGKILRIDVDHPAGGRAYGIPANNPFIGNPSSRPEIWLYGLRNPWRMSFDRATGDLWIGDVGQDKWEEVDVAPAGKGGLNFGWNRMEGLHCYSPATGCDTAGLTMPVAEYGHGPECAVIGGFVYRGAAFPVLQGGYLFADYCSGTIFAIPADATRPRSPVVVGKTSGGVSGFGEDGAGELYLANLDGTISKVVATSRP
jgi:glucose/arabinose dehydrogenase